MLWIEDGVYYIILCGSPCWVGVRWQLACRSMWLLPKYKNIKQWFTPTAGEQLLGHICKVAKRNCLAMQCGTPPIPRRYFNVNLIFSPIFWRLFLIQPWKTGSGKLEKVGNCQYRLKLPRETYCYEFVKCFQHYKR